MNMQFLPAAMSKQLSALLVSGVAFLTACGGTAATNPAPAVQPGDQQVTLMVGNSMQFMPGSIAVRAGQPIDLVLRNGAGIPTILRSP